MDFYGMYSLWMYDWNWRHSVELCRDITWVWGTRYFQSLTYSRSAPNCKCNHCSALMRTHEGALCTLFPVHFCLTSSNSRHKAYDAVFWNCQLSTTSVPCAPWDHDERTWGKCQIGRNVYSSFYPVLTRCSKSTHWQNRMSLDQLMGLPWSLQRIEGWWMGQGWGGGLKKQVPEWDIIG